MGRNDCITLDEAIQEFEFDCKIRHLSPKTIDNYKKQLWYFERFLANELSITSVENVKPSHTVLHRGFLLFYSTRSRLGTVFPGRDTNAFR